MKRNIRNQNTKKNVSRIEPIREVKEVKKLEGYRICAILGCGKVVSFNVLSKDQMEMRVLEIMEDSFKKIVVLNRLTGKRSNYLPK
jgi:precorrin-6x reductase